MRYKWGQVFGIYFYFYLEIGRGLNNTVFEFEIFYLKYLGKKIIIFYLGNFEILIIVIFIKYFNYMLDIYYVLFIFYNSFLIINKKINNKFEVF